MSSHMCHPSLRSIQGRQKKEAKEKATPRLRRGSLRYSYGRAAAELGPLALRQSSPTAPGRTPLLGVVQRGPTPSGV